MTRKTEQEYVLDAIRLLMGRGKTQRQIAMEMHLSLDKTNQLVNIIKAQSKENIQKYVNEELPLQYENTLSSINQIIDDTWEDIAKATNQRDKNNSKSILMQALAMRVELLSSADTLRNTVKFVDKHLPKESKQEDNNKHNEVTEQSK